MSLVRIKALKLIITTNSNFRSEVTNLFTFQCECYLKHASIIHLSNPFLYQAKSTTFYPIIKRSGLLGILHSFLALLPLIFLRKFWNCFFGICGFNVECPHSVTG